MIKTKLIMRITWYPYKLGVPNVIIRMGLNWNPDIVVIWPACDILHIHLPYILQQAGMLIQGTFVHKKGQIIEFMGVN